MDESLGQALSQAYDLIESGKLDEARAVLRPFVTPEQDNPDVWWVYAHAVTDVNTARDALQNVLRLDPDYPGARELLTELDRQITPEPVEVFDLDEKEPAFLPEVPATVPDLPRLDDEPGFTDELEVEPAREAAVTTTARSRNLGLVALAAIIIILLLIGALLLMNQPGGAPVATQIAQDLTPTAMDTTPLALEPATEAAPADEATETGLLMSPTVESAAVEATPTTEGAVVLEASPTVEGAGSGAIDMTATPEDQSSISGLDVTPTTEGESIIEASPTAEGAGGGELTTVEPVATVENGQVLAEASPTAEVATVPPVSEELTPSAETPVVPETADFAPLYQALASFSIPASGITIEQTNLGDTLIVTACTTPGPDMRTVLPQVMDTAAQQVSALSLQAEALAVRALDCSANVSLRTLGTTIDRVLGYAGGTLSVEEFEAGWQPVG